MNITGTVQASETPYILARFSINGRPAWTGRRGFFGAFEPWSCEPKLNCTGHGSCGVGGYCVCDEGWAGKHCSQGWACDGVVDVGVRSMTLKSFYDELADGVKQAVSAMHPKRIVHPFADAPHTPARTRFPST